MRVLAFLVAALAATAARAEVVQIPHGARAVPLGRARVVCGSLPDPWSLEGAGRMVRPPAGEASIGRSVEARVAADAAGCAQSRETVTLVVTGRWPEIDPAAVSFFPDEGRLELKGTRLAGAQIRWDADKRGGQDRCLDPSPSDRVPRRADGVQVCVIPLERGLPMDTTLRWAPAGARFGADVTTYDLTGQPVDPARFVLRPSRTVIAQLLPPASAVDASAGSGKVALVHPRAVGTVDCGVARCELGDAGVVVRGVPLLATQITLQLRLAPRVFLQRGEKLETSLSATLPLVHCPLSIVSGLPLRDADETQILIKLDARCSRDTRLRWTVGGEPAEVARAVRTDDAGYALLKVGRIASGSVTVTATRADAEGGLVGSVTSKTAPPPRPHASVELPGYGRVDFVPTNRDATLAVADPGEHASLVPLAIDGVYTVRSAGGRILIRGDENAGGLVSLRFGYRVDNLPTEFAAANLAVLTEQVQRPIRDASIPAPFGVTAERPQPLIEFGCADKNGNAQPIPPGKPVRIPYDARDTCRVTLHQERVRPEDGLQEIVVEIDVSRAQGGRRPEASVDERVVLRPGGESRTFWLKAVTDEFDHVVVRASHVLDETRYVLSPTARQALPSIQWSATVEGGWARLYATVAIPAGLYRMNEPTGQLTLNFGVLSRLTWLDRRGKEGLLGMELGLMGMGLIPQRQASTGNVPRSLAAVLGLGVRIELGAGAAVGVHLWGGYEFRDAYHYDLSDPNDPGSGRAAPHWALYFGPSITIGNAGTNL